LTQRNGMSETESIAETWYEATRVASPERPRLTFDHDVDLCVIGGGLAGLTVAREVAKRGWSVAVLEAGRIAWAASGRNTGFVLPGFHEDTATMIERIGLDHTRQLWALSERGVEYVRRTIEETGMPGVDPVPGWLHISKTEDDDAVRSKVERLRWIGGDVEAWTTGQVRAVLPNPRYFGAMHFPNAFHIHPLNYALGLAADAEKAGVRIFEETPALAIDPAGVRKRITTPNARLRAPQVVLACNVHLGDLMPELSATLLPITTFVMVTEPLGPQLAEVIRYRGGISDTERADNHYRIVGGDNPDEQRLQWSGRVRLWDAEPRFIGRSLRNDIRRNFPELGKVEIASLWSGTLGRAIHRMPQIGEIDKGLWVASAFGAHGLNTTALAGDVIARGIVDNDDTWRMFAPYELVWAGGKVGRAIAQGLYWGSRPLDRIEQVAARYREGARARKAARMLARASGIPPTGVAAALAKIADLAAAEQRPVTVPPSHEMMAAAEPAYASAAPVEPMPIESIPGAPSRETMPPEAMSSDRNMPDVTPPEAGEGRPAQASPFAAFTRVFGRRKRLPEPPADSPPEAE
jgi:gamma-glutamylputrescine oxidase